MCGIAGCLQPGGMASEQELTRRSRLMADELAHRGPDDAGSWVDTEVQLGFGHRRLAVIDLTAEGHQPMVSADGRWVLCFNGEIYNHGRLRKVEAAKDYPFRGSSDTEVLLAAIARLGPRAALTAAEGMFALAVYDRRERRLYLARDRFGEKPLFYGRCTDVLLFGSELKALQAHPDFRGDIDRDALATYMRFKYVPAPRSIFRQVHKLPPGTILEIDARSGEFADPVPYFAVADLIAQAADDPYTGDLADAVDDLAGLLRRSVADRLVADVPVGAFLSGGIDSTTVVATAPPPGPVRTFTVGYQDEAWDEARRAADVADRLGTDHHELRVSSDDVLQLVPALSAMYDEPFGDSSQLPTHLVARFARQQVTVAITGDGGDEVFGGYNRHVWGPAVWRRVGRLPRPLRRAVAGMISSLSEPTWDQIGSGTARLLPRAEQRLPGQKAHKLARALQAEDQAHLYRDLLSHWRQPERLVPGGREFLPFQWPGGMDFASAAMAIDLTGYLPDDILQKVDRATMAVALEARVPFLDSDIVRFAWRLPQDFKIQGRTGKRILRSLLDDLVPGLPADGPKMGFGVPVGDWLRGPLRGWATDLIDGAPAFDDGFVDRAVARAAWADHLGGANRQYELWTLLMFLDWHARSPTLAGGMGEA
ncbi:MAG: asparagine synthase (glutamine-hydrolyzing) [Dehalococcoidia bacterium]